MIDECKICKSSDCNVIRLTGRYSGKLTEIGCADNGLSTAVFLSAGPGEQNFTAIATDDQAVEMAKFLYGPSISVDLDSGIIKGFQIN